MTPTVSTPMGTRQKSATYHQSIEGGQRREQDGEEEGRSASPLMTMQEASRVVGACAEQEKGPTQCIVEGWAS